MTRNQAIVDASGGGFTAIVGSIYERGVEEERKLAEQYGMPYGEEVNDAQE